MRPCIAASWTGSEPCWLRAARLESIKPLAIRKELKKGWEMVILIGEITEKKEIRIDERF